MSDLLELRELDEIYDQLSVELMLASSDSCDGLSGEKKQNKWCIAHLWLMAKSRAPVGAERAPAIMSSQERV